MGTSNSSELCKRCSKNSASKVCTCHMKLTALCQECIFPHRKEVSGDHFFLDLEVALDKFADLNNLNAFYTHMNIFKRRSELICYRQEVSEMLGTVLRCKEDTFRLLVATFDEQVIRLNSIIQEIDEIIGELDCSMNMPSRKGTILLNNLTDKGVESMLTEYPQKVVIDSDMLVKGMRRLIRIVDKQNLDETQEKKVEVRKETDQRCVYYPVPYTYSVVKYDPKNGKISSFDVKMFRKFPSNYRMCRIGSGDIFICGGYNRRALPDSYIIQLSDKKVKPLTNMLQGRRSHAIVYYSNSVYVFGGWNEGYLSSCEQFNLAKNDWQPLPKMNKPLGENWFSVCVYKDRIFIPSVGIYDPISRKYEYLDNSMDLIGIAVTYEDKIYLLSNSSTLVILQDARETLETVQMSSKYNTWSTLSSYNNAFYFISPNLKDVYEFSPVYKEVKKLIRINIDS